MRSSIPLFALVVVVASAAALLAPRAGSAPSAVTLTRFTSSTTAPGHTNPSWCPDGSQIAFDDHDADPSNPALTYQTYPGGSEYPMAASHRESVDYAPDLTQVAYAKLDGTWEHIYLRPMGGTESALTTGTAGPSGPVGFYGDWQPSFSPDGQWVAFASSRGDLVYGTHSIWVVKTDGTGLKKIGGTIEATWPTWEPGGNAVVYTDAAYLYRVARTGLNTWATPVKIGDFANHARFSHDGKYLAYDYQGDIYVMDYATKATAKLTNDGMSPEDSSPTWGATDDLIAFSSSNRGGYLNAAIWIASGVQSLLATPTQQVTLGKVKATYR